MNSNMGEFMPSLVISELRAAYQFARITPEQFFMRLLKRIEAAPEHHVWITRLTVEQVMQQVDRLRGRDLRTLPLYGVPFVVKDNIDVSGIVTTAGCPAFAYTPTRSATVVTKLMDAGAILLGKTNMDQFATGLVGARSPYGEGLNSFDPDYVSGGSSSGSALAVAMQLASFSLGTDTAGSGRVPAAFNNLIGLKPSIGRLSTHGLVPACRSIDCISIFAMTAADANVVLHAAQGHDAADPWSRPLKDAAAGGALLREQFTVAIPLASQLQFFGDEEYARLFRQSCNTLASLGAKLVERDFSPLFDAAKLLYEGPWVAERYAAVQSLIETQPDALHPVTRQITLGARVHSAVDTFKAMYQLQHYQSAASALVSSVDALMTPTAGTLYRLSEVLADPIQLNANLGYYTNFMNLLDLAAVAVPAGFRRDGLPFGVTLFAGRDTDVALLHLAERLHRVCVTTLGAKQTPMPLQSLPELLPGFKPIAVCGAHLQGLPLNGQLLERGAYLLKRTRTAAAYRLFSLPGGPPHRPGLLRAERDGYAIDLEVWALPLEHWGSFMAGIPAPLCIGQVQLEDGGHVAGFLCERYATAGARDISAFGSWRTYLATAR